MRQVKPTVATSKRQLQDTLDQVGSKISELLNPALSREDIILSLQDLDDLVNGSDDEDDSEQEDEE